MKTPKKETKEVINEAFEEVTGKSIDEKKAELLAEIEKQNKQDEIDCLKAVEGALKQYNCTFGKSIHFIEGRSQPIFEVRIVKNVK